MDWVHCNNCFLVPCADKSFHLTSCGHIFCRDCEEKCARGQCKLCGNQCSTIVLSSSMKPDVQKFFTDPDELLRTKIKEVQQVSEFQKNHRARLVAYQRKQLKKFDSIKQDFRKLLKNFKDVENERKRLHHENNVLKKVARVHQSPKSAEYPNHYSSNQSVASHHSSHRSNNSVSSFMSKMDNAANTKYKNQRVSVISPPSNGKMGVIQGTPSPASLLRGLCLNSANSSTDARLKNYQQAYSLESSPASQLTQSVFNTPVFPEDPPSQSPIDAIRSAEMHHRKKMVVHPFSPDTV